MTEPWQPANDTERALLDALAKDDRTEFFRVIASADLYLPQRSSDADDREGQEFVTVRMLDHTFLPVFTSVEGMAEVMSRLADAYTVTTYSELREKWPVPEWRLAVNPGFPPASTCRPTRCTPSCCGPTRARRRLVPRRRRSRGHER